MPLNALPVTADELEDLQFGLSFNANTGQATSQAALINLDNGVDTVASYAAALLNANIATSQVAMATTCLMWGTSQDTALLDNTATVAAPLFIALAIQLGTNQVVTAAEGIGVALANDAQFAPFLALNATQFTAAVAAATDVNVTQINTWLANWIDFYTTFGTPAPGVTIQEAAYGATFGDAIGVALLNPTSANLQTVTSTNAQGETVIEGDIANHLLTIATGQYVAGIDCDLLPDHTPLQGEAGSGPLTLTIDIDTPPQFETDLVGAVFNAPPGGNQPLGTTNTLNTGDTLVSTVGDATLNFTAVNNLAANPGFASGVSMTGIATVNINNQVEFNNPNDQAGFAGDINGLTTLTLEEGSNPFGHVQVGLIGDGLNTALETLNINAGLFQIDRDALTHTGGDVTGGDVNIWTESSAFAGGEALDLNLGGVGSFVDLNVTGGDNFYETVNVHSLEGDNHVDLGTNAETITTVNADGDQNLRICGDALNQDTLTTFDANAATGDVTAIFEGENEGGVDVTGGNGNDNFWFLVTDPVNRALGLGQDAGETTFTATDSVDGGGGENRLTLQAFEGALLGAGVGPNITGIQTIEHTTLWDPCFFFDENCIIKAMQDDLTVDMANSGSATVLELAGAYGVNAPVISMIFDVDVTNLENADTVIFSGRDIGVLTLEHVSGAGTFNLVMAQDPCVEDIFGPETHRIAVLDTEAGAFLIVESTGSSDENSIFNADLIDTDITATGDVDLSIGGAVDFDLNGSAVGNAYDFDGGLVNASELEGDLFVATGHGQQRVFTGSGDDYVIVNSQIRFPNPGNGLFVPDNDLVDLSTGGSDTVQFDGLFDFKIVPITFSLANAGAHFNEVLGFDPADDVIVLNPNTILNPNSRVTGLQDTTGHFVAAGDDPLVFQYSTGSVVNASLDPFNFIKIIDPVNPGNQDAAFGFDQAMGGGSINVALPVGFNDTIAGSYYDASNGQMVLFSVTTVLVPANSQIEAGDDIAVIAVVAMSRADYAAFGADNLSFTPFV